MITEHYGKNVKDKLIKPKDLKKAPKMTAAERHECFKYQKLFTRDDAALFLGCCKSTISNYIKDGSLKAFKRGQAVIVSREELLKVLKKI